jgi:hypothetical protein
MAADVAAAAARCFLPIRLQRRSIIKSIDQKFRGRNAAALGRPIQQASYRIARTLYRIEWPAIGLFDLANLTRCNPSAARIAKSSIMLFNRRERLLAAEQTVPPLVLADESTADQFVTGGLLQLPAESVETAVAALAKVKADRSVSAEAEIHCRVLFHGDARRRSPFAALNPHQCVELVTECVAAMNAVGGTCRGCWVNRKIYPTELRLVEGQPFRVEPKHLAGLMVSAALVNIESYRLAFDPDPTKIDWGLARKMQATHFSRINPQAIALPYAQRPLMEMADIAAYTLAQSLVANVEVNNRKARRFRSILRLMDMRVSIFEYRPLG